MDATQIVLIVLIALMLIAYPIIMSRRNKMENQKMQDQANSLKKGDEVITSVGVYGKIIEIKQDGDAKKVTIETGNDKNKSYLTVDAYSIYTILNKDTQDSKIVEKSAESKIDQVIKEDKNNQEIEKNTESKKKNKVNKK